MGSLRFVSIMFLKDIPPICGLPEPIIKTIFEFVPKTRQNYRNILKTCKLFYIRIYDLIDYSIESDYALQYAITQSNKNLIKKCFEDSRVNPLLITWRGNNMIITILLQYSDVFLKVIKRCTYLPYPKMVTDIVEKINSIPVYHAYIDYLDSQCFNHFYEFVMEHLVSWPNSVIIYMMHKKSFNILKTSKVIRACMGEGLDTLLYDIVRDIKFPLATKTITKIANYAIIDTKKLLKFISKDSRFTIIEDPIIIFFIAVIRNDFNMIKKNIRNRYVLESNEYDKAILFGIKKHNLKLLEILFVACPKKIYQWHLKSDLTPAVRDLLKKLEKRFEDTWITTQSIFDSFV